MAVPRFFGSRQQWWAPKGQRPSPSAGGPGGMGVGGLPFTQSSVGSPNPASAGVSGSPASMRRGDDSAASVPADPGNATVTGPDPGLIGNAVSFGLGGPASGVPGLGAVVGPAAAGAMGPIGGLISGILGDVVGKAVQGQVIGAIPSGMQTSADLTAESGTAIPANTDVSYGGPLGGFPGAIANQFGIPTGKLFANVPSPEPTGETGPPGMPGEVTGVGQQGLSVEVPDNPPEMGLQGEGQTQGFGIGPPSGPAAGGMGVSGTPAGLSDAGPAGDGVDGGVTGDGAPAGVGAGVSSGDAGPGPSGAVSGVGATGGGLGDGGTGPGSPAGLTGAEAAVAGQQGFTGGELGLGIGLAADGPPGVSGGGPGGTGAPGGPAGTGTGVGGVGPSGAGAAGGPGESGVTGSGIGGLGDGGAGGAGGGAASLLCNLALDGCGDVKSAKKHRRDLDAIAERAFRSQPKMKESFKHYQAASKQIISKIKALSPEDQAGAYAMLQTDLVKPVTKAARRGDVTAVGRSLRKITRKLATDYDVKIPQEHITASEELIGKIDEDDKPYVPSGRVLPPSPKKLVSMLEPAEGDVVPRPSVSKPAGMGGFSLGLS